MTSNTKTLIFSDLDGTLLDHFTYSTAAAEQTLAQLHELGIPVILNTSKTFAELETIIEDLALTTPFVIENGAAVYIPVGTFKTQPEGTVLRGNYWMKSFSLPREHWLTLLAENTSEFALLYQGFSSLPDEKLKKITGLSLDDTKKAKQRQYGEPIQWLGDDSSKSVFIKQLKSLGANIVQGGRFIHIGDFCDKGQALTWLTAQYLAHYHAENHAKKEAECSITTIALGDGENDIAMLEVADIAVQIRSPTHDFVTLTRENNVIKTNLYGPEGWAEALQEVLGNQLRSNTIIITQE